MFIPNSLNMPSPILPLKVDLLIQEEILSKTSKKKKKKGEAAALFFLKSLRTPELPFKLQPRGLQGEGLALQYRLESPLPWPWLPGWPRPQRPWTSATARESGRLWFPPGPPGSPTAQWHHQVRSVSKSKERTSIRIQARWSKILLYFTYARETLFLFSFWIYSIWSETIWEENRSSYHSLPGVEVNPRKDSETKVGISFKRWLLSRCTHTVPKEHTLFI